MGQIWYCNGSDIRLDCREDLLTFSVDAREGGRCVVSLVRNGDGINLYNIMMRSILTGHRGGYHSP